MYEQEKKKKKELKLMRVRCIQLLAMEISLLHLWRYYKLFTFEQNAYKIFHVFFFFFSFTPWLWKYRARKMLAYVSREHHWHVFVVVIDVVCYFFLFSLLLLFGFVHKLIDFTSQRTQQMLSNYRPLE